MDTEVAASELLRALDAVLKTDTETLMYQYKAGTLSLKVNEYLWQLDDFLRAQNAMMAEVIELAPHPPSVEWTKEQMEASYDAVVE